MRSLYEPSMPPVISKAKTLCDTIAASAKRFHRGCKKDGEVAVILASDGFRQFHLLQIGELSPETVLLLGETDEGHHIETIAHYSAVQVAMIAMPQTSEAPKRRGIGFSADHREDVELLNVSSNID